MNSASTRSEDNARLVVARVANFGTFNFLNLFVDGVVRCEFGGIFGSHEVVLPPGRHVLSVTPEADGNWTHTIVNAEPGRTYAFTARWINDYQVRLDKRERRFQANRRCGNATSPLDPSCGSGR